MHSNEADIRLLADELASMLGTLYDVVWLPARRQTFTALVKKSSIFSSSVVEIKLFHLDICITYTLSVSLSLQSCNK